jgi:two-component system cell cycle sensor histidine kinase/response regulator CckA
MEALVEIVSSSTEAGRIGELEREIVECRKAESILRRERDLAQGYLNAAEVILLALDNDGRIALVNRHACSVLGWTAGELLGRDWFETCLPARIRDGLRPEAGNLPGDDRSNAETPVLTRPGEERLIEWRNTILRDDAGRVSGTFMCGADITERNKAAEALRTGEERVRLALQHADVGIGIWDMDYATGVLRWSETLEAQYGLQPGTFGGTFEAFVERIHPDDRTSVLETFGSAMKSGADFSTHSRSIRPDGSVRWLTGAGRIHLAEHGEPVRGVGISLDVTERHTLEEQYHQARKMEAIGRLAGGVAHDFNNLLTVIVGNCELLLADLDPDDPHQADIAEIRDAGACASGLTRKLLTFSRTQIIEPALLDLNVVAADMQAMLGSLIGEDVNAVFAFGRGLAPIKADRGQVEQVILNLAVNARDAMPRGGTLTIETAEAELDEHDATRHFSVNAGRYVVLTVTDTGTGMTPQARARLFEPFFTTKDVGKGTGLGLATVHSIVTQNGGSVTVSTEAGSGTTFKVYFPRADAEIVHEAPPPVSLSAAGPHTVLVVDDAEELRELTGKLLKLQGYTVLVAGNADEALGLFERNASIDVLLTDVVMPGVNGPELASRLVERRPALKVIYMSGYAEDAIVKHGLLNPGSALLHKPFNSEALGQKISDLFRLPATGSREGPSARR